MTFTFKTFMWLDQLVVLDVIVFAFVAVVVWYFAFVAVIVWYSYFVPEEYFTSTKQTDSSQKKRTFLN